MTDDNRRRSSHLTRPMVQTSPPRIDIGLFDLLEEYLAHGDLVSQTRLGLFPHDKPRSVRARFEPVGRADEFNQLEKEVLIRHRLGYFQATVKAFYFADHYISTGLGLPWRRLRLSALLRWLRPRVPARELALFYFVDAEQGALLVRDTTAFHFQRWGAHYYVSIIETGAAGDPPQWHYSAADWIKRLMTPFGDAARMRELAGDDAQGLAALTAIGPYLSGD